MKLTLQLKLIPDTEQSARLLETMRKFNEAATFAAQIGFEAGKYDQSGIHALAYFEIRSRFGLSAQMATRAIDRAVWCFRKDKTRCPKFKPLGVIVYDRRIFSFKGIDRVSLWALPGGRVIVPMVYGDYQRGQLSAMKGQAQLAYRDGCFFLYATTEFPDNTPVIAKSFIGVDFGVNQIASTSDGEQYSGSAIKSVRHRHRKLRSKLHQRGTRSAKRKLRKLSGRERRFAAHTNHVISKQIVAEAKRTGRGIAVEELTGIRERVTARRKQRAVLHSWAFAQLRAFLTYKAALAGIPLVAVDPRNTSRTCTECGHCAKENRKSQEKFRCVSCSHTAHADINAAINIGRAAGNRPIIACCV